MQTPDTNLSWIRIRKCINDIHLWAGLISGLVLLIVCLTGTLYVYNTEIREWAASHLYRVAEVPEEQRRLTVETILGSGREFIEGDIKGVRIPYEANRSIQVVARAEGDQSRFGTTYFFDPYTAAYLGNSKEPNPAAEVMGYLFSLHRWLLLDRIEEPLIGELDNRKLGSYITGSATLLFTLGVLTGLVIWVPKKTRYWRKGLKIKFDSNWKRINHDLHNTLAFYSAIVLFLMGATGPYWSFPWYREGLKKTLGTYQECKETGPEKGLAADKAAKDTEEVAVFPLDEYVEVVERALPYSGSYSIDLPQQGSREIRIRKQRAGFFAPAAADQVVVDAGTKAITEMSLFRDQPFNQRVSRSIKALHVGNVYGSFSKLLYFISCLIATSLPVTGTLIWINKMKKTKQTRKTAKRQEALASY
ncbi:PepSY-associated TM helix domain-containing protein [Cyclobacterium xiamenense]|uniref:PepSY-associated TM helix domain-containing protein n=1 Tax=Cyclobacterium xiamenense TaxID=1297121 RepID=UPI0035D0691C